MGAQPDRSGWPDRQPRLPDLEAERLGTYTMTDAQKRPARVSICVKCRYYRGEWRRRGKQRLVYAFGGLMPPSFDWVKETYRQRFAIETTYRQLHQARIRTSTRDPLRRLLYVGMALMLRNVWVWLHWTVLARPRRGGRGSAWTCSDSEGCCCGWRMWSSRGWASATRSRSNFADDQGLRHSMTTLPIWIY